MLCQLSYNHRVRKAPVLRVSVVSRVEKNTFLSKATAKVLLFFDITKYFAKKMSRILIPLVFDGYCADISFLYIAMFLPLYPLGIDQDGMHIRDDARPLKLHIRLLARP